jgi:hypothetical protein
MGASNADKTDDKNNPMRNYRIRRYDLGKIGLSRHVSGGSPPELGPSAGLVARSPGPEQGPEIPSRYRQTTPYNTFTGTSIDRDVDIRSTPQKANKGNMP